MTPKEMLKRSEEALDDKRLIVRVVQWEERVYPPPVYLHASIQHARRQANEIARKMVWC